MNEPPPNPVIEVTDLCKSYRGFEAVTGVSFSVSAGSILGLVGPNGAGKTTTIRAACGIHPPSSGRLCIDGHDVVRQPLEAKRRLAYVPDDPQLFGTLTVWEHLRFVASAYDVDAGWAEHGERLLQRFELGEKRHALAQDLSRGMRQKLAICCARLHRPGAMFLDEPLTGLDPRGIRTMKDAVRRWAGEGTALVISSHLLSVVEDLCGELLVLHRGQRLYFGPLAGLREAAGSVDASETLEDVFLRMTEEGAQEGLSPR